MKKIRISYRWIRILSFTLLLLSLLPLLVLAVYAVPAADDFSYGAPAHLAYETGGFFAALAAAAGKTWESYFHWQGSFSAIFLMALQPAVFSLRLYALTPVLMLLPLLGGTFFFCRALFSRIMKLDPALSDSVAALWCLLSLQLLPSPVQGLYWFNGAVYYTFFHGLSLIALALAVSLIQQGGAWRCALLCLLGVALGGGNYVTGLTLAIVLFFALLLLILMKHAAWKRLLLPGALFLLAFVLNLLAPGNAVRQAAQEATPGVLGAILLSFQNGFTYGCDWLSLPVLGGLVLTGILGWPSLCESRFSFRFPLLVSLFSYCLLSAMFCPPLYAMGNVGDQRLTNLIFCCYLLLLTINLLWWLGWLSQKRKKTGVSSPAVPLLPVAAASALLLACFALHTLSGGSFCSLGALSLLRSGEAQAYHDCAQRRFAILENSAVRDAVLEPFPCQPYLLYFDDITTDPDDWRNTDMSSFFGKDQVRVMPSESE